MLLTVQDNGKGFDVKANGHGMGLRIMRYRAQCIGGSCEVQSSRASKALSSIAVCRCKPMPSFLPSHDTERNKSQENRTWS